MIVLVLVMFVDTLAAKSGMQIPRGLVAIKIAARDLKTSIDYYVKYFGMKARPRLNAFEQGLEW